jgi:transposase
MRQTLTVGGEVWIGDETALREFPPLRAGWAKRGHQQQVVISGRNAQRVIWAAVNVVTGELVRLGRERARKADAVAFIDRLGQLRPSVAKLLVWDNAPPHQPTVVRQAAEAAHSTRSFLPFRAPELNPCEDLWRLLKGVVAANRAYANVEGLLECALAWLDALTPTEVLRRSGLASSKFNWLPT